ncbi:MAG: hypothetical protein Q8R00_03740 [Candidatus Nanoarchaeia archaeon]|nr:hypothetical protein [Candidatus Nanoarchaeia archaeon]
MALDLRSLFVYWESIGVFDVLLPFFLIFSVSFAILEQTQILKNKKINAIIAGMIGVLFVNNPYLVGILQSFVPNIAMVLIVILMFLLVAGTFLGAKGTTPGNSAYAVAGIIALVFVLWALVSQTGYGYYSDWAYYFDDQTVGTILLVGVFVFIIWFVTRDTSQPPKFWNKLKEGFKDLWGT